MDEKGQESSSIPQKLDQWFEYPPGVLISLFFVFFFPSQTLISVFHCFFTSKFLPWSQVVVIISRVIVKRYAYRVLSETHNEHTLSSSSFVSLEWSFPEMAGGHPVTERSWTAAEGKYHGWKSAAAAAEHCQRKTEWKSSQNLPIGITSLMQPNCSWMSSGEL